MRKAATFIVYLACIYYTLSDNANLALKETIIIAGRPEYIIVGIATGKTH